MKRSVSQKKITVERFIRTLEQTEDLILGLEDKVDLLEHIDKDKEKTKFKGSPSKMLAKPLPQPTS
jgi:hypothetical protein